MQIARSNRKFNQFPTPKYRRIRNIVIPDEVINPRLELINIIEKEKKSEKNTTRKNNGSAPVSKGSIKYMIPATPSQRKRVMVKVNKKFFRSITSLFLSIIFGCLRI